MTYILYYSDHGIAHVKFPYSSSRMSVIVRWVILVFGRPILLTTSGSNITKDAKAEVEKNKNTFLSWMQAELLPNISNNTLQRFNNSY